MPSAPESLTSAELERLVTTAPVISESRATPERALGAWLAELDARPGASASVGTSAAYVLFRDYCAATGALLLDPYDFSRAMAATFRRKHARIGEWRGNVYLMGQRAASRIRKESALRPPMAEDRALFSWAQLRQRRSR